jgi:20S proteasome subunit beta 2
MYSNPYHTTGSGSLAAMAILETYYKDNMEKDDAIKLVVAAIEAGIYHDLGSGSNVDVAIITKGKVEYLRNLKHDNAKVFSKPDGYSFRKDRVQVLEEFRHRLVVSEGEQPMEIV